MNKWVLSRGIFSSLFGKRCIGDRQTRTFEDASGISTKGGMHEDLSVSLHRHPPGGCVYN